MEASPLPQRTQPISLHGTPVTYAGTPSEGPGEFDISFSECLDKALTLPEPAQSAGARKASQGGDPTASEEFENGAATKIAPDAPPVNLVALLTLTTSPELSWTGRSLAGHVYTEAQPPAEVIALPKGPAAGTKAGTAAFPSTTLESASAIEAALDCGRNADDSTPVSSATQDNPASRFPKEQGATRRAPGYFRSDSAPETINGAPSSRRVHANTETSMEQPEAVSENAAAQGVLPTRVLSAPRPESESGMHSSVRQLARWNTSNEPVEPKDVATRHSAFGEGFTPIVTAQPLAVSAARTHTTVSPSLDADKSSHLEVERDSSLAIAAPVLSSPGAPEQSIRIASHPTRPEWRSEFLHRMQVLVTEQTQVAELQLNAANMGPVSVQITINEHQANIVFGASHDDTRRAIEQALPQLRDLLNASGIRLDSASVGDQASRHPGDSPAAARAPRTEEAPAPAPKMPSAKRRLHLLDTYA